MDRDPGCSRHSTTQILIHSLFLCCIFICQENFSNHLLCFLSLFSTEKLMGTMQHQLSKDWCSILEHIPWCTRNLLGRFKSLILGKVPLSLFSVCCTPSKTIRGVYSSCFNDSQSTSDHSANLGESTQKKRGPKGRLNNLNLCMKTKWRVKWEMINHKSCAT